MSISGFTMVKNAGKCHFPIKKSILSVLPIADEFIVALGDCDIEDNTKEQADLGSSFRYNSLVYGRRLIQI